MAWNKYLIVYNPKTATTKTDQSSNSCGWIAVRFVKSGTAWHPAKDHLLGTSVYGTANDDSNNWSVKFSDMTFNQFLFTSGDRT